MSWLVFHDTNDTSGPNSRSQQQPETPDSDDRRPVDITSVGSVRRARILGNSGYPIRVGRRAKIFTAEDAEDAETKTEGMKERIEIGRPSQDESR